MKKWIIRLVIALVIVVILVVAGISMFLDSGVKRAVEVVGPKLTKVDVKLNGVSLSLLSGSGALKGLVIGNPEGYKSPAAISVGKASMKLQPRSVFADKIVIESMNIEAPEITFETNLKENNLSKIMANIESATGGGTTEQPATKEESKAARKLQVDDFVVSGGKIHVSLTTLAGKSVTVPLPTIHFEKLGQGPEGITAAELAKKVLSEIEKTSVQAASGAVSDLAKDAVGLGKEALGETGAAAAEKVTKGIGGLFKKK